MKEVKNERSILAKMRKESNILNMKSAWQDSETMYILTDLAINGDLTNFLNKHGKCPQSYSSGPLSEAAATHLSAQLLSILNFLRQERIIHRDIKPANLLMDESWKLVLADFGSAKKKVSSNKSSTSTVSDLSHISGNTNVSSVSGVSGYPSYTDSAQQNASSNNTLQQDQEDEIVGTSFYVSPEMIEKQNYSYASDLWAFGVIVFQLFTNKLPFLAKTTEEVFELIKLGKFSMPESTPEVVQDLIRHLIVLNPHDRLGSQNIQELN